VDGLRNVEGAILNREFGNVQFRLRRFLFFFLEIWFLLALFSLMDCGNPIFLFAYWTIALVLVVPRPSSLSALL